MGFCHIRLVGHGFGGEGCLSRGVPTLQTFWNKPGGPGEDGTLLPQPQSFRSPGPAAAHLREGGETGDLVQEAVAGGGGTQASGGHAGDRPGMCWGFGARGRWAVCFLLSEKKKTRGEGKASGVSEL